MTTTVSMKTPIGVLQIEGDDEVITLVTLPGKPDGSADGPAPESPKGPLPAAVAEAVKQLEEYFAGERTEFDLPLDLEGTAFQKEVWSTLGEIPYGKTISYAEAQHGRAPHRLSGRRPGERCQPDPDHPPVSPGARQRRPYRWIRRRSRNEATTPCHRGDHRDRLISRID